MRYAKYIDGRYIDMTDEEIATLQSAQRAEKAAELTRPLIESEIFRILIAQQINSLSVNDATASRMTDYFPELTGDGALITAGTRINWRGQLKRAAVDLWDNPDSSPDAAPNLWEDIDYKDGVRIIPEIITAGTAFALDELGWWGDVLYRSKLAANTYTPEQYPAGWEKALQ